MAYPAPADPFWQWIVPSTVVLVLTMLLVLKVLRAGPGRLANRALASILVVEASLAFAYCLFGDANIIPVDEGLLHGVVIPLFFTAVFSTPVLYLGLLSTLSTPIVAWLRRGVWALFALPVAAIILLYLRDVDAPGPQLAALASLVAVYLFAVVAAVHTAYRAVPGSPEHARAKAFAIAFVVRDLLTLGFWAAVYFVTPDVDQMPAWKLHLLYATNPFALIQLVYLPLLAYGILRTRLFDIDLRIKRGISAGTLTAVFVVVFFVASEVTQQFVGERAGPYAGIFAAGALLLAISPLKRFAMRASDVAMPGVNASEAYIAERKLHVYRAAVEGAYEDGKLGAKERSMLTRLGAELGLDPREMVRVEDEVRVPTG